MLNRLEVIDNDLNYAKLKKLLNKKTRIEKDNLRLIKPEVLHIISRVDDFNLNLEDKELISYLNTAILWEDIEMLNTLNSSFDNLLDITALSLNEVSYVFFKFKYKTNISEYIRYFIEVKDKVKNFKDYVNKCKDFTLDSLNNIDCRYIDANIDSSIICNENINKKSLDKVFDYFSDVLDDIEINESLIKFIENNEGFDFKNLHVNSKKCITSYCEFLNYKDLKIIKYHDGRIDKDNFSFYLYKTKEEMSMFRCALNNNHIAALIQSGLRRNKKKFIKNLYEIVTFKVKEVPRNRNDFASNVETHNINLNTINKEDLHCLLTKKRGFKLLSFDKEIDFSLYKELMNLSSYACDIFELLTGKHAYKMAITKAIDNCIDNDKRYSSFIEKNKTEIAKLINSKNILPLVEKTSLNIVDVIIVELNSELFDKYRKDILNVNDSTRVIA